MIRAIRGLNEIERVRRKKLEKENISETPVVPLEIPKKNGVLPQIKKSAVEIPPIKIESKENVPAVPVNGYGEKDDQLSRSPKGWWNHMFKEAKRFHPNNDEESLRCIVAEVWSGISFKARQVVWARAEHRTQIGRKTERKV